MDNQVEEIKLKTDIVTIIGERIDLKKAGRNFKANCPFHGEKTPSFMISQELQIYKCFGCGEAGDVFNFLEKFEGMDFPEALNYLADRAGIKLIKQSGTESSEKERIFEISKEAARFYHYMLTKHVAGKRAYDYLQKDRGLTPEIIEEFNIGYSPKSPDMIQNFLINKKKFTAKDIETAGIGFVRGRGLYDRFNDRVIFPLYDHRGNNIGFSGRVLPWDTRETGKYINSPDTPAYHKSKVLYGLNVTRQFIKKKSIAIIVEGELDAISSFQAGIRNIVAIKGSALTEDQVRLLSRFCTKFILALDSDLAGDAAARRGLVIAANMGIEVKVAKITGFKDPDEAVRKSPDTYKKDLIRASSIWDFLLESVFSKYDSETGQGKAKISREIIPVLSSIEDRIVQNFYVNRVAQKLGVTSEAVSQELAKSGKGETLIISKNTGIVAPEVQESGRRNLLEKRLLILSFFGSPAEIADLEGLIKNPFNSKIKDYLLEFSVGKKKLDLTEFAKKLPPELFEGFSKMVMNKDEELSDNPDDIKKELDLVKKELKILEVKESLKKLADEIRIFENKGDKEKLQNVQNKFGKLTKKLSGYEDEEGNGIILKEN
jgi:DNA primase